MIDDYSKAIKELREKMLLSQVEFAQLLGVSLRQLIDGKMDNMNQLLKSKENLEVYSKNTM